MDELQNDIINSQILNILNKKRIEDKNEENRKVEAQKNERRTSDNNSIFAIVMGIIGFNYLLLLVVGKLI